MPTPAFSPYIARGRSSYRNVNGYLSRTTGVPSRTSATMCGWFVRRANTGAWAPLFGLEAVAAGAELWSLLFDADGTTLDISNGSAVQTFSSSPAQGQPFFGAIVSSGSTITGYWRGLNDRSFVSASMSEGRVDTPTSVFLCNFEYSGGLNPFDGGAWNIRIWDVPLTAAELLRESFSSWPLRLALLNSWYPLEGNLNQLLLDYSGNGRHLTRSGSGRAEPFFLPASVLPPLRRRAAVYVAAGGGATVDLASVSAGQATPTGTLSITARLVAAALGIATPAGTISVALNPAGAVAGAALVAGALSLDVPLQASAQAVAQTGGNLGAVKPLAGVSAGLAAPAGDLTVQGGAALAGGIAGQTDVRGNVSLVIAFGAGALGQALVQGAISTSGSGALAGSALGRADPQGSLSLSLNPQAAAAALASVGPASLALVLNLGGAIAGVSVGGGTLIVEAGVSAAALSQALVAGGLSLAVNLSAGAVAQALAGGSLTGGAGLPQLSFARRVSRARRDFRVALPARAWRIAA